MSQRRSGSQDRPRDEFGRFISEEESGQQGRRQQGGNQGGNQQGGRSQQGGQRGSSRAEEYAYYNQGQRRGQRAQEDAYYAASNNQACCPPLQQATVARYQTVATGYDHDNILYNQYPQEQHFYGPRQQVPDLNPSHRGNWRFERESYPERDADSHRDAYSHRTAYAQPIRQQEIYAQPIRSQVVSVQPVRQEVAYVQPVRQQQVYTQPIHHDDDLHHARYDRNAVCYNPDDSRSLYQDRRCEPGYHNRGYAGSRYGREHYAPAGKTDVYVEREVYTNHNAPYYGTR